MRESSKVGLEMREVVEGEGGRKRGVWGVAGGMKGCWESDQGGKKTTALEFKRRDEG